MPKPKQEETQEKKESQADVLIRLGSEAEFLRDELEEPYAALEIGGHIELMKVSKGKFQDHLTRAFYQETGKSPNLDALNQALSTLKAIAKFDSPQYSLQRRVAERNGRFYYDLCDNDWRVVRISNQGCNVLTKAPYLFQRSSNMKAQVKPNFEDGNLLLLKQHLRLRKQSDWILCLVYVVTCFIPTIPHPVLILAGEKGASKSTSLRMLKAIVDPAMRDLLAMPNSKNDLALSLANSYMPCFDNLDNLSAEKSDLLCMASTGGAISKRKLFTDEDEVNVSFKRCVGMNGINVVATRSDLLDRSLILELERIPEDKRKEESLVWKAFNQDLPKLVGGAMMALSKAMSIYPTVQLDKLLRMADFTRWGYAVAETLGLGGDKFLKAYRLNQTYANEEAIESNPVAAALVAMMEKELNWQGTVKALFEKLQRIAHTEKINTSSKTWPEAPQVLSRRMNEIKSNLEQKGIYFNKRNRGDAKVITLEKRDIAGAPVTNNDSSPSSPITTQNTERSKSSKRLPQS